jgi:hypothetical protein
VSAGPGQPVTFWPRRLLIWATAFSVLLAAGCFLGWFALDPAIRERFTVFQISTLLVIAGILIGIMMSLGLSMVRADREGLKIRNSISTRHLRWSEVSSIQYRHGDPWAFVILAETEDDPVRRQMIAIQSTDGNRADRAVETLRAMHARYRAD